MSQSQDWNSSFLQEDRDAHICPNCVFLRGFFKISKEKKTCCQTTVLYNGIFRCLFLLLAFFFWCFCVLWCSFNDNYHMSFFQATKVCPENKRDRKTLEALIHKWVQVGTKILTDGWASYKQLEMLGYIFGRFFLKFHHWNFRLFLGLRISCENFC